MARAAAACRGFYRFRHAEGHATVDPTEGLLGPKLEQRLPRTLSRKSVVLLLQAIDPDHPLGLRDQAILHTLYATGCRVSEVTGLRTTSIVAEHRMLRAFGKGNKERLIPIADQALALLERYRSELRPLPRAPRKTG